MNQFGQHIKMLREQNGLLQRQIASRLEIDTPMLSKIERGERTAKRNQIKPLCNIFGIPEKELLTIWLTDKILNTIESETDIQQQALQLALNTLK